MFVVFHMWAGEARSKEFKITELSEALQYAESLRKERMAVGSPISHVTLSSENPNSVGQAGAADVGPDYNWKKRRTQ